MHKKNKVLCALMEGRSHWPPSYSPIANKMPSGPDGGGKFMAIVVILHSSGTRSLALAVAGHFPENLVVSVKRDLSSTGTLNGILWSSNGIGQKKKRKKVYTFLRPWLGVGGKWWCRRGCRRIKAASGPRRLLAWQSESLPWTCTT
jgi:hypothetical protein